MVLVFDKQRFKDNAPSYVKRLLPKEDLEALDGKSVIFDNTGHGKADYTLQGESFYMYPIFKDWCRKDG